MYFKNKLKKKIPLIHFKHLVLLSIQLSHGIMQFSHIELEIFANLFAEHTLTHEFPSKKNPILQIEHSYDVFWHISHSKLHYLQDFS